MKRLDEALSAAVWVLLVVLIVFLFGGEPRAIDTLRAIAVGSCR